MSISFEFVGYTPNRAIYKITSVSGDVGTLTNQGAATPDLSTDIPANTPIGAYLRRTVASDAAAAALLINNVNFKMNVTVNTTGASTVGYMGVSASRDGTSGLAQITVRADADGAVGDVEGTLELELFHTIAK